MDGHGLKHIDHAGHDGKQREGGTAGKRQLFLLTADSFP